MRYSETPFIKYPAISFVIPMYNESANIEDTVGKVAALAKELADDYEIILADDASSDGTGDIADRLQKEDAHIKSVRLKENTKFGGALAAGLKKASKDIIIYTDADLPVKKEDVKKGLALLKNAADLNVPGIDKPKNVVVVFKSGKKRLITNKPL